MSASSALKVGLGRVPWTAEAYQRWLAGGEPPAGGYRLDRLAAHLPGWIEAVASIKARGDGSHAPRQILLVGGLQWWVEHVVAMGLLLAANGDRVDLAYLPYRRWVEPMARFDLRRQQAYLRRSLRPLAAMMALTDLSAARGARLGSDLETSLRRQADLDTQYTLQREDMDYRVDAKAAKLFQLRLDRNRTAAAALTNLLRQRSYHSVVIPNGSILEFGAAFRAACAEGVTAVTYEFGEQRGRMWLARDDEVMRLHSDDLWAARGQDTLQAHEMAALEGLYQARRGGLPWGQFARRWQAGESQGARGVRQALQLPDDKKLVLLCTNVVGDSLALDRQIFTHGMADWLVKTVAHLADRSDCLLVVRVHPGELLGAGHPSREILHNSLPELADKVVLIPPESDVNTYDLIDLAHLGLVYTTTVGMEMAMAGVPVVVAGDTHYRGKGFTYDAATQDEYFELVDQLLGQPPGRRLPADQVEAAFRYAYRFFFEFPFPYPWHIVSFWEDMLGQPLEDIARPENRRPFSETLSALGGAPIDWRARQHVPIPEVA